MYVWIQCENVTSQSDRKDLLQSVRNQIALFPSDLRLSFVPLLARDWYIGSKKQYMCLELIGSKHFSADC